FFCVPGLEVDGHDFAPVAVAAGAVGLMVERGLDLPVPQAVVSPGTARASMARAACAFFDYPARSLLTVGVTGTNGKTGVAHLMASILDAHGAPCAVIGTLDGARTTPEAPELQKILDEARRAGRTAAALEVSSHALTQARVDGIRFDAAVFTNLSHDHLDHHRTMESYFAAKASLFTEEHAALAVVNVDDPWGRRLADQVAIPLVTFSSADATAVDSLPGRTSFVWRQRPVVLGLTGRYHVLNALAAATAATALGVDGDTVVHGLERSGTVAGRFELVDTAAPFTVVVDYAHTPEGLAVALDSARRLAHGGRVVCVFGCGGDRDQAKRPVMGGVASGAADVTVVTSDNPRHEDPAAIIDAVMAGAVDGARVLVEPDRARAIALALSQAGPGDVVLVAGKGHETVIEVGDRRLPFDDRLVAAEAVTALVGSDGARGQVAP
ncbi:MAG: UDP-N-acetylmuramoyl-L-alanyl-D-glutamate--2,6-diaminopimelate ligase, partial [Acidimicrobiales bacterium]